MRTAAKDVSQRALQARERYVDGRYLEFTGGTWHSEDSAFKTKYLLMMIRKHDLKPADVLDIGCGGGGILQQLQKHLDPATDMVGYDISPQAHDISRPFENAKLHFLLGDGMSGDRVYDLVLAIDVVEHMEDPFGFLRRLRSKGRLFIFHIPLEVSCLTVLLDRPLTSSWRREGHLHKYTVGMLMELFASTGHEVIDHLLTPVAFEAVRLTMKNRLAFLPRKSISLIGGPQLAQRILGGFSLMALTRPRQEH